MKGKVLMLFLLILVVNINATEEELHEYLACVFIVLSGFHLLKQHWWISMRGRMFRKKCLRSSSCSGCSSDAFFGASNFPVCLCDAADKESSGAAD